jgi:hypothetical protein
VASKSRASRAQRRKIEAQARRAVEREAKRLGKQAGATAVSRVIRPRGLIFRYRYQLAPLAVLAALWVAAYFGLRFEDVAGPVLLAGALATAGAWLFSRRWLDRLIERVYAATCLAGAAGWLGWAVTAPDRPATKVPLVASLSAYIPAGPTDAATRVLVVAGVALAVPWWRHYRIRPTARPTWTTLQEVWTALVWPASGILPGATLTNVVGISGGQAATIELVPGKQTTEDAVSKTGIITSALRASMGSLVIEPTEDGVASRARLMYFKRNPLLDVQRWPGPHLLDPATGLAEIGRYADGCPVNYVFWVPGFGPWHDLISGTTGAGKSRLLDMLLAYERSTPLIVSWVNDTQNGQSLPDWQDNVDWFTGSAESGLVMLRAVRDVMYDRSRRFATRSWVDEKGRTRKGVASFTPTAEEPLIVVTLEESSPLLRMDEAVEIAADLGKMARKTGIKVRLVNHVPLVSELGGSLVLRDMVSSGNVLVFRTASRFSGEVAFQGSLPVSPHQLPRKGSAGMGFSLGAESRPSMMRTFLVEDPFGYATSGHPGALELAAIEAAGEAYRWRNDPDGGMARPEVATGQSARKGETADRVLAILRDKAEPLSTGDLIKETGAAARTVREAVQKLLDRGLVHRTESGAVTLIRREA